MAEQFTRLMTTAVMYCEIQEFKRKLSFLTDVHEWRVEISDFMVTGADFSQSRYNENEHRTLRLAVCIYARPFDLDQWPDMYVGLYYTRSFAGRSSIPDV